MAQSEKVSEHAYQRGRNQFGTLGSGIHSLEVSWVDKIYESRVAEALGLEVGQVTLLIHSASRRDAWQAICVLLNLAFALALKRTAWSTTRRLRSG
jgi:RNA-splicing ligase RtcB